MTFLDKAGLTRVGEYINTNFSNDRARITAVEEHPLLQTGGSTITILPENIKDLDTISVDMWHKQSEDANYTGTPILASSSSAEVFGAATIGFYKQSNYEGLYDNYINCTDTINCSVYLDNNQIWFSFKGATSFNEASGGDLYIENCSNNNFALIGKMSSEVAIPLIIFVNTSGTVTANGYRADSNIPVELTFSETGVYTIKTDDGQGTEMYINTWPAVNSIEGFLKLFKGYPETELKENYIYKASFEDGANDITINMELGKNTTILEKNGIKYIICDDFDGIFLGVVFEEIGEQLLGDMGTVNVPSPGTYFIYEVCESDDFSNIWNFESLTINDFTEIPERFIQTPIDEIKSHPLLQTGDFSIKINAEDIKEEDLIPIISYIKKSPECDFTGTPIQVIGLGESSKINTFNLYKQTDIFNENYNDYFSNHSKHFPIEGIDSNDLSFNNHSSYTEITGSQEVICFKDSNDNFIFQYITGSNYTGFPLLIYVTHPSQITLKLNLDGLNSDETFTVTIPEKGVYASKITNNENEIYSRCWCNYYYAESAKLFKYQDDLEFVNDTILSVETTSSNSENSNKLSTDLSKALIQQVENLNYSYIIPDWELEDFPAGFIFNEPGTYSFESNSDDPPISIPSTGIYLVYILDMDGQGGIYQFNSINSDKFIEIPEKFIETPLNEIQEEIDNIKEHPLYPVGEETITLTAADLENADEAVVTIEQLTSSTWDSADYYNNLTPVTSTDLEIVISNFGLPFPVTGAFYKVNENTITYNQAITVPQHDSFRISLFGESSSLEWDTSQPSESSSGHTAIQNLNNDNFAIFVNDGNSVVPYLVYINNAGNIIVPFYISNSESPTALTVSAEINFPSTGIYSILLTGEIDNNTVYLHPYQYYTYTSFSLMKFKKVSSETELNNYFEYNAEVTFNNLSINWSSDHIDEVDLYDNLIPGVTAIVLKALEGFMLVVICPNGGSFTYEEEATLHVPSPGIYALTYADFESHGISDINFISVITRKLTQIEEKYIPEDLSQVDWNISDGQHSIINKPFWEVPNKTITAADLKDAETLTAQMIMLPEDKNLITTDSTIDYEDKSYSVDATTLLDVSHMDSLSTLNLNTLSYVRALPTTPSDTIDIQTIRSILSEQIFTLTTYDSIEKTEISSIDYYSSLTHKPKNQFYTSSNDTSYFIDDYGNGSWAICPTVNTSTLAFPLAIVVNYAGNLTIKGYKTNNNVLEEYSIVLNFPTRGYYLMKAVYNNDTIQLLTNFYTILLNTTATFRKTNNFANWSSTLGNYILNGNTETITLDQKTIKTKYSDEDVIAYGGENAIVSTGFLAKRSCIKPLSSFIYTNESNIKIIGNLTIPSKGFYLFEKIEGIFNAISYTRDIVQQIDGKFIPNSDWNAFEHENGYIKNKPFGRNYSFEGVNYDGTENRIKAPASMIINSNNTNLKSDESISNYIKISEPFIIDTSTKNQFINKSITITEETRDLKIDSLITKTDTTSKIATVEETEDGTLNMYDVNNVALRFKDSNDNYINDSSEFIYLKKQKAQKTYNESSQTTTLSITIPESGIYTAPPSVSNYYYSEAITLPSSVYSNDGIDFPEYLSAKNLKGTAKFIKVYDYAPKYNSNIFDNTDKIQINSNQYQATSEIQQLITYDIKKNKLSSFSGFSNCLRTRAEDTDPYHENYPYGLDFPYTILDDFSLGTCVIAFIPEDNMTLPIDVYDVDSELNIEVFRQSVEKTFSEKGIYIFYLDAYSEKNDKNYTFEIQQYLKINGYYKKKYISYMEPTYETKALAAEYMPYRKRTEITPTFINVSPGTSTTQVFHEIDHVHLRTSYTGWSYEWYSGNPDVIWTVEDAEGLFDENKFTTISGGSALYYHTSATIYASDKPYLATLRIAKTGTGSYSLQLEELTGASGQKTSTTIQPGIIDIYVPAPIE